MLLTSALNFGKVFTSITRTRGYSTTNALHARKIVYEWCNPPINFSSGIS